VEACDLQLAAREGQAGPCEVAERPVVPTKPGNAGRGNGSPGDQRTTWREPGDWREPGTSRNGSEATDGVGRQSEGKARDDDWVNWRRAVDAHVTTRLRQWLCGKHKQSSRGYSRYPDRYLTETLGLVRLPVLTRSLPWAKA